MILFVITSLHQLMEATNFFLGIPLFSLLFFFYARIGIVTIGIPAKTHQVLTAKAQTAESLQKHIPRTFLSCPMDWILYAMIIPYKVSRLSDKA